MRTRTLRWGGCGLTWRSCRGWCSGGRRSGRARSRPGGDGAAAGGDRGSGTGKKRGPGARAGRRDYSHLPRVEVIWDFEGGYCCPECGVPFTLLGSDHVAEQLDWLVIVRVRADCRRRYRRACSLPGPGHGDGARPAEGDRQGPGVQRVHRDAADGAVRRRAEHELAGDGPVPAGRGHLAGHAGRDVRAGRGAAGPGSRTPSRSGRGAPGTCTRTRRPGGCSRRARGTARRSGGCGCSSARTPPAS